MPIPLVPLAGLALRYGSVALAAYAVTRSLRKGRTDQGAEDALDQTDDGLALHRPLGREQGNLAARLRRRIWIGGRGYDIDAAALMRLRIKKV